MNKSFKESHADDDSESFTSGSSLRKHRKAGFDTTRWTLIQKAQADDTSAALPALERLCSIYWYPLYAFVRRRGYSAHEAEDLTQEFFLRFLSSDSVTRAQPQRGKFRSFLLGAMKHFLANQWHRAQAQKRGGGHNPLSIDAMMAEKQYQNEPADPATPEDLFDRRWALTLIEQASADLRTEMEKAGKGDTFEVLKDCLTMAQLQDTYAELARRLGKSEGAVKVAVHRLRKRYRSLVRERIADTVQTPEEIDGELSELFAALSG